MTKPNNADRLLQLEEMVRQLTRRIEHAEAQRLAEAVPPANLRLAYTYAADSEDYPEAGLVPGYYPFVFVTATPPPSVTYTKRSQTEQGQAIWPHGRYLPINTLVVIGEDRNGTYFIVKAYTHAARIQATVLNSWTSETTTIAWGDFTSPVGLDGEIPSNMASATIENRFSWDGQAGALVELAFDFETEKWYLLQLFCE